MASQPNANPIAVIRQNLEVMAPEFRAALPAHVPVEKFTRVAMTAIQNNPDLQKADRRSLFGAIVRLAQDGLLPDGREAAIVMFGNKAQAMPMIAGVLKKIRQSGDVAYVSAQIVYANDHFKWTLGFNENVEHEPAPLDKDPGEPMAAYAVAVLKDGSKLLEVMRKSEIEKVRNVSRAKNNGPWVTWWGEMARKTVMRRLSKRLPMSTDLEDQFDRDETMKPVSDAPNLRVVEAEVADEPTNRLDALEQHIGDDEGEYDNDTGEVIEESEAEPETVEAEIVEDEPERDAFGLAPLPEQQTEEQPNDDASPADVFLTKIRGQIGAAKNAAYLKATDEEWTKNRAAYDDATASEVDGLITARRRELSGEGGK